jgi:hypothetical protein
VSRQVATIATEASAGDRDSRIQSRKASATLYARVPNEDAAIEAYDAAGHKQSAAAADSSRSIVQERATLKRGLGFAQSQSAAEKVVVGNAVRKTHPDKDHRFALVAFSIGEPKNIVGPTAAQCDRCAGRGLDGDRFTRRICKTPHRCRVHARAELDRSAIGHESKRILKT